MPHFTLPISSDGPIVAALVAVSEARRGALSAAGQPVPPPVRIRALVDTGASCTCIDEGAIAALGIPPTGRVHVLSPTTGATPADKDQFDVALLIPPAEPSQTGLIFPTIAVITTSFAPQPIQALIGRDILRRCLLTYNGGFGPTGFFTLAY